MFNKCIIFFVIGFFSAQVKGYDLQLVGSFKDAAVIEVDGEQRMLKVGKKSPEGLELLSANARQAVVKVDGQTITLAPSRRIASTFKPRAKTQLAINAIANQYKTSGQINGVSVNFLVDTGATHIALNSQVADRLGINYLAGKKIVAVTANGPSSSYEVNLHKVEVGGITVYNVLGIVLEGDYPLEVLLGMSFLNHVNLREENRILYLEKK